MERNCLKLLREKWSNHRFLCVGLDTDLTADGFPPHLLSGDMPPEAALIHFNVSVIEATKNVAAAYKLNLGFYLQEGPEGVAELIRTIGQIHKRAEDTAVILDGKFGDIGNSSSAYARFAFDVCKADAVTVHPYLGKQALKPFWERQDKGVFVLARTSNPGAGEFQDISHVRVTGQVHVVDSAVDVTESQRLFELVATKAGSAEIKFKPDWGWNENGNIGLVAGATSPEELGKIREAAGDNVPILIPGIGKQGGDLEKSVANGISIDAGAGILVNSSRSLIFAWKNYSGGKSEGFAQYAGIEAQRLHEAILGARKEAMEAKATGGTS